MIHFEPFSSTERPIHVLLQKVARALAPLSKLDMLQIHLDALPAARVELGRRGGIHFVDEDIEMYSKELPALAELMARTLARSVQTIGVLVPSSPEYVPRWINLHILRDREKSSTNSSSHAFTLVADREKQCVSIFVLVDCADHVRCRTYWYPEGLEKWLWY